MGTANQAIFQIQSVCRGPQAVTSSQKFHDAFPMEIDIYLLVTFELDQLAHRICLHLPQILRCTPLQNNQMLILNFGLLTQEVFRSKN